MKLRVHPCTIGEAKRFADLHHSHHDPPISGLCAVGVANEDGLVCVAILGRPVAKALDADPMTAEVVRVASDRTPHAASMALGAITRAALVLGYTRLVSYLLLGEAGTTYRACGWWPARFVRGEEHDRPARPRARARAPARASPATRCGGSSVPAALRARSASARSCLRTSGRSRSRHVDRRSYSS